MSESSTRRRVGLIAVAITVMASTGALAQAPVTAPPMLPAAAPGLPPIPRPPLDTLESAVATQLRVAQESFHALATRDSPTSDLMEAYGVLGQLYHAYELFDSAEASYRSAAYLGPRDHRWRHLLGRLYEQQGRLEDAETELVVARAVQPDYSASAVRLGLVRVQLGKLAEARRAFTAALEIATDPAIDAGLGEAALAERRYADAISHLSSALERAPGATRLHYPLAMAYRGLGSLEEARAHLARRGESGVAPRDPLVEGLRRLLRGERVNMIQGQLAFAAGQFHAAAAAFAAAVAAAPDSVRAYVDLGAALAQSGEVEGGIEALRTAVSLDPANATGHFNLGVLLAGRGDAAAITHFESTLALRPDDSEARRALVAALLASGRDGEAEAHLTRVVDGRGLDEAALMQLVELQARQGRYREALERLDRAYTRWPTYERLGRGLARLLAASPDATIRDGERALKIANVLYNARPVVSHGEVMALALAELGRCAEAVDWQRRLVAAAERAGQPETVAELTPALSRYAAGPPCRPPTEPR